MRRLAGAGALASASQPVTAWAQQRTWEWHWEMHPVWGALAAWGIGILVLLVLLWALLTITPMILGIIAAVLGIRWLVRVTDRPRADSAVAILRERYARGEISKDEFDARMRDLMQG